MVLFFGWHQISVEPKSSSCLSMTGEDTGLEALASPLAGYLGKVQERAASLDSCPWCTSKGLSYALRSYRINLQESITLCTNPQCLFPLVTRPLEDVLASLDHVVPIVGNKRKHVSDLEKEDMTRSPLKLRRSSEVCDLGLQIDSPVRPLEHGSVSPVTNGLHSTPKTVEKVNGYHKDCPKAETAELYSLQHKDVVPDCDASTDDPATSLASSRHSSHVFLNGDGVDSALSHHLCANGVSDIIFKQKNVPVLNGCSRLDSSQDNYPINIKAPSTHCSDQTRAKEEILIADFSASVDTACIDLEDKDLFCTSLDQPEKFVSVPTQLLWRNADNLCWLDSLLAALLNCKNLHKCKPKDEPHHSPVWQLMRGYEEICAAVQVHQQHRDGVVKVPSHVLQKANVDLQSLRMSVFKLLQPKLQCKLGQMETPVFALPLLLTSDSRVEHLFQSTFQWEFRCSKCKAITKERVMKTLPTFTNIVPDWRPLNAAHYSPCNMCGKKNQMRTMFLESLSPVFALHFVEGLPDNDVSIYTFTFRRKLYSVSTLIQYNHQLKHFVTWIRNEDGSWIEYDDLKHPNCKIHKKLQVPAHEMHVVFWEEEEAADLSPSAPEKEGSLSDTRVDELLDQTPDQSFPLLDNDTDIICALTEDSSNIMDTTVTAGVDTSIGDRTLLNTFEGLSHNDIITLTLVEVDPVCSHQTKDTSLPTRTEMPDPSPDSSLSTAGGSVCHEADVEPPATVNSSNTESVDSSSSDATSVPGAKRRRGRRTNQETTIRSRRGEKAASQTSPPAPSELPKEVCHTPAQDKALPVEITQQASPESSTDTLCMSTSQKSPPLDQKARWSFLLSKHPLNHFHKSITKPNPTQTPSSIPEVKPSHPLHYTPNPIKRQMIPPVLPKPQLITEDGMGLPPKAAEMYCGFGTKSSTNNSPLSSPQLPNGNSNLFQTITSDYPAPPTVISGTLPPIHGAKLFPEVCSSKKHGSYSSMVPPGLGKTEALRYKLLKKLKAKKKKLARLNQLLGNQEGAFLRPDSTDLTSPSTVTSSTYDDDFLSDLLSPATTASNLSPDSTGFLELLANGQDGADDVKGVVRAAGEVSQNNCGMNRPENENFLEDFLVQCGFETN